MSETTEEKALDLLKKAKPFTDEAFCLIREDAVAEYEKWTTEDSRKEGFRTEIALIGISLLRTIGFLESYLKDPK